MNHKLKTQISNAINAFKEGDNSHNGLNLFKTLGYDSNLKKPLAPPDYQEFFNRFACGNSLFREDRALADEWIYVDILFQISKDEITGVNSLFSSERIDDKIMESYLFFIIELTGESYSRTILSQITREVNKLFPMPAMIMFKHGTTLTFAIIDRRLNKRDEQKDVLEKVFLIKDISIINPHRAHIEILADLSLGELIENYTINNFIDLHNAWAKTLDTRELNKRFYQELSNWYFWAMDKVSFPDDIEKDREVRNAISLIRLLTRVIFIWFIKEKSLVPDNLFNPSDLKNILKEFCKNKSSNSYYHAILQNLFFGTLNQKMEERAFAEEGNFKINRKEYGVKNLFRYADLFAITKDEALALFKGVPFLNGGLFDCLDRPDDTEKIQYFDGFSRKKEKQANVPDYLFFSDGTEVDLNAFYGTKNKKYKVKGLIDILANYKFTVTENTPIEEEVALDPELLGKVFENLLASFNPETKTTARKQTGSFYTPREIVNYMVDESLIIYFSQKLEKAGCVDSENGLRKLLSYSEEPSFFNEQKIKVLIKAINGCKILDPACGSGAFPMGILHKLVHILHKLDPDNKLWKERQIENAYSIEDISIRNKLIENIEIAFEQNELDYGRKLYLIENCIYGVDIQPIAVQIAKLRFFISLIIDQKKQLEKENLGIEALPNLETKFVAANTLIGLDKPEGQISFKNPDIVELEENMNLIRHRYFNAKTRMDKLKYQRQDKEIRGRMADLLKSDRWNNSTIENIVAFDPYDQNSSSPFFDMEWMFGIRDGFDVVIGNPPYVEHKKLKDYSSFFRNKFKTYSGTADLYVYFYEISLNILKENGILTLITSNKFIKARYGFNLRGLLALNRMHNIIDFTKIKIFDALVASCIIIVSKNTPLDNISVTITDETFVDGLADFIDSNSFTVKSTALGSDIWQLTDDTILRIKDRIERNSIKLGNVNGINIFRGVTTGYNPAFIINEEIKNKLIKKDNNAEIIKPALQGRNIRKWTYDATGNYLIFTRKGIYINKYPTIKNYLSNFRKQLEPGIGRKPGNYKWYEIQDNTAYYQEFEKEKIIWGLTSDKWYFSYDNKCHILPSNGYILTSSELPIKYLLALINSRLMEFYFSFIGIMTAGGAYTLKRETIAVLPIKVQPKIKPQIFIEIVDIILSIVSDYDYLQNISKKQKVRELEKQIDRLIYELYELSEEEVNIVERKSIIV